MSTVTGVTFWQRNNYEMVYKLLDYLDDHKIDFMTENWSYFWADAKLYFSTTYGSELTAADVSQKWRNMKKDALSRNEKRKGGFVFAPFWDGIDFRVTQLLKNTEVSQELVKN